MTGWLLDTNALSAFAPGKRPISDEITIWFEDRTDTLFLSTVTAAEIEAGIAQLRRMGAARRADNLREWFDRILDAYAERILSFDLLAARIAGKIGDAALAVGRHPGFPDVAIAAIAMSRDLVVLTLNRRHFDALGVEVFNPFPPYSGG
ncbi:MAG TPA: PIN domain-containing protein [Stellaceae bacterium]